MISISRNLGRGGGSDGIDLLREEDRRDLSEVGSWVWGFVLMRGKRDELLPDRGNERGASVEERREGTRKAKVYIY